jgi:hypothetical protein
MGYRLGQSLDYAFTGKLDYGPFQAAGAITNDVGMFIYSGGTLGAMFSAQKVPTIFSYTYATTVPLVYSHSLFYDIKPLKK